MNRKIVVAPALAILLCIVPATSTMAGDSLMNGELSISVDKTAFDESEPIVVTFRWKNMSRKKVTMWFTSGDLWGRSRMSVRDSSSAEIRPKPTTYESFFMRPVTLRHRESFIWAALRLDEFGYSLPPGTYTVADHFEGPDGISDTNSVTFSVL